MRKGFELDFILLTTVRLFQRQQASLHQSSPQLDDTKTSESVDIDNAEGPKKVFLLQDDDLE